VVEGRRREDSLSKEDIFSICSFSPEKAQGVYLFDEKEK